MDIYTFTVTRASTAPRAQMLFNTLSQARQTAGCDFHWEVWAMGGAPLAMDVLEGAANSKLIQWVHPCEENIGQHVAFNAAMARAREAGARYILRLDDDVEFITRRWLAKLVKASDDFKDKFLLSPVIRGLRNPVARSEAIEIEGHTVQFLKYAIGGICRLHPLSLLDEHEYVSDVRLPLGAGDATGIARWCIKHTVPMAYLKEVRVKHAHSTEAQEQDDPAHFENHALFQHIPYMAAWRP